MSDVNSALLLQQLAKDIQSLKENRGHGPSTPEGGSMEPRVAKLEAAVEFIQRDISEVKTDLRDIGKKLDLHFYMNWGGLIAVALGLAALMAKGFHWI